MQISNTNTVFFFESSPFQTKRQGAQMPFCEHSCLRAAKHDSAAMPTSSKTNPPQYASPPVDLVRMLFIVPQTNRIADEHLDYTASLSSQQKSPRSGLASRAEHISHCCLFYPPAVCCESPDRRLHSCLFASHCAVTQV